MTGTGRGICAKPLKNFVGGEVGWVRWHDRRKYVNVRRTLWRTYFSLIGDFFICKCRCAPFRNPGYNTAREVGFFSRCILSVKFYRLSNSREQKIEVGEVLGEAEALYNPAVIQGRSNGGGGVMGYIGIYTPKISFFMWLVRIFVTN